jgi:hypothetical protein
VVYNCCWPSPAQSFSGRNPAGLMNPFYCLRFETPPAWKASSPYLYPPRTGWPGYIRRHWVPFSPPPTARRATVKVFNLASTRDLPISRTPREFYSGEIILETSPGFPVIFSRKRRLDGSRRYWKKSGAGAGR